MHENGMAEDRAVDGGSPPNERWRSRSLRALDELLDDLLGSPADGRPDRARSRSVPLRTD